MSTAAIKQSPNAELQFITKSNVKVDLISAAESSTTFETPDKSGLKEKANLIFEYEGDGSQDFNVTSQWLADLTLSLDKNPFGVQISNADVVNQTVFLLKKFISGDQNFVEINPNYLSTISKYFRLHNLDDLEQVERKIFPQNISFAGNSKLESLFYDVLATSGSNPTVMLIKKNIQTGLLVGEPAARVLTEMFRLGLNLT